MMTLGVNFVQFAAEWAGVPTETNRDEMDNSSLRSRSFPKHGGPHFAHNARRHET
jgi:hypothetical protein